jgi:signal transduction histidine kinase
MSRHRWRNALALGALALIVVCVVADLPLSFAIAKAPRLTTSESYGGGAGGPSNFAFIIPMVLLAVLATTIVVRRGGNRIGWLLLGAVVVLAATGVIGDYGTYALAVRHRAIPGGDIAVALNSYSWVPFVAMIIVLPVQLFPDGSPLSPRWRWLPWATVGLVIVSYIAGTFGPGLNPAIHFPHATTGALGAALGAGQAATAGIGLCGLLGLVSLVLRYRRSPSEVRHQILWLLFAGLLYVVPFVAYITLKSVAGINLEWLAAISVVGLVAVPFATAIAVLRYRLYDIDIIVSRTIVYGSLAVLITGVYIGIAVGIGDLVGSGGKPNLGLSILATAIVAVGFQPIRQWLQRVANRLVYGTRATPYEVLSQFSDRVAAGYAVDDVLPRMAQVLFDGTGAERADVWLRSGSMFRAAASWPADAVAVPPIAIGDHDGEALLQGKHLVEVRQQDELLGALSVTKRAHESLTPIEERLLSDLANQAGLVLKNVRLTTDLQARLDDLRTSRQRLVAAQDNERRRLERNLHDGAQQHLVAIKVKLGLVELLTRKDPEKARATIVDLKHDADEALETLRDLARGIYPPLLADKGLLVALQSHAAKATLPVRVDADGVGRYPQETEAALYFCTLEALQNVQKYADASRITVHLRGDAEHLEVVIVDDGRGFDIAATSRGSGLTNMEDRLNALGGTLELESAVGVGTTLRATVPIAHPVLAAP